MSISGMPSSREGWPPEVLTATALFKCGDVVESPPNFYFANPSYAVLEHTKRYAAEGILEPEVIDAQNTASPFGLITSQTCDIGEVGFDQPSHPFVSVSPVFEGSKLPGDKRSLLKKGKRIGAFYHVPLLKDYADGFWVADFRLEMPVEKSWLVGRTPIQGFTEEHARLVPRVIAEIKERPAWSPLISDNLQPLLLNLLRGLKATSSAVYQSVVSEISEIGARSDSMLNPNWIQIAAFTSGEVSEVTQRWWTEVNDSLRAEGGRVGVAVHTSEMLKLEECPVATYRAYVTFPLTRFSPA